MFYLYFRMKIKSGKRTVQLHRIRWYFSVLIMLGIYLSTFLSSSAVLPHTHYHHEDPIAEAGEQDPCHITLFHPGLEGGCHHKTHLINSKEPCNLSHITLMRESWLSIALRWDIIFIKPIAYYFCPLRAGH